VGAQVSSVGSTPLESPEADEATAKGSRVATERDINICSACGRDEAIRDFTEQPPVPPDEWPVEERREWNELLPGERP
jgi:hypothetical protein